MPTKASWSRLSRYTNGHCKARRRRSVPSTRRRSIQSTIWARYVYDRCYELVNKSALQNLRFHSGSIKDSDPTPDIIQLANLCMRYKFCRTTLLIFLCGVLRWINEDTLSLLAFSCGISDAIPQYNKFCDGCRCDISESTGCFTCKSCKDVDLCRLCFVRYEVDELKDIIVTCQDHPFLDFSKTLPIEGPEQWL